MKTNKQNNNNARDFSRSFSLRVPAKVLALLMSMLLIWLAAPIAWLAAPAQIPALHDFAYADDGGYEWNYYRYDDSNNAVVNRPTPTSGQETGEKWAVKFGDGVQDSTMAGIMTTPTMPIIVNGKMYLGLNKQILEVNKNTGAIVRRSENLSDSVGYAMNPPLYADGKIFMQVSNGKVCAVDANSFKLLWTAQASTRGQTLSPLAYKKVNGVGYVYTGTWTSETTNGSFFAVTTDSSGVTGGTKKLAWEITHKGGFYWSGAYAGANYIAVGSDDGVTGSGGKSTLYILNPATGKTISSLNNINGDIRCSIVYENGLLYFSTTAGYVYKVKVDASGKLGASTNIRITDKSIGAPVVYKGRIYVGVAGQGGIYSSDGGHSFAVIKDTGSALQKVFSVPAKGFPRSGALISNAYENTDYDGDGKADGRVYVYFTYNSPPGGVYCIYDEPTWNSQSDVEFKNSETELFVPGLGKTQYCISTIIADQAGTLYYRNDSAYMFALEQNTAGINGFNVFDGSGKTVKMSPGFDNRVTNYEGVVSSDTKDVTVDVDAISGATIKVNGSDYTRYGTVTVPLKGALTEFPITATKSGKSKTYTISIRKRGSDVGLSYIASNSSNGKGIGNKPMTPGTFSDSVTKYSFNWIEESLTQRFYNLWILPSDENAKVRVYPAANGNVSGTIEAKDGGRYPIYYANATKDVNVKVEVTSDDGSVSKIYDVTIQREEVDMSGVDPGNQGDSTELASNVWKRLYGNGRYDTMKAIVDEGFTKTGGTVVVATGENFKDALAASGLAGIYDGPIVLTNGKTLSAQARSILQRLKPSKIYIAGGTFAVSDNVKAAIDSATGVRSERLAGANSAATSAALALAGRGRWSSDGTAIIATNKSFKDALSVSPIAYAKGYPVLLADSGKSLSKEVQNALTTLGIKNVIIVGGEGAVTPNVVSELSKLGIAVRTRLGGQNGVETSSIIARWGLSNGLSANRMGVATSQNFPDALGGAALCGYNKSVLVLADDKASLNSSFPSPYKSAISRAYVFGGKSAVGIKTWNALVRSVSA